MATTTSPRLKKCPECQHFVPSTAMIQDECPDCAGLVPLPPLTVGSCRCGRWEPRRAADP
jgi:hypothetical protein